MVPSSSNWLRQHFGSSFWSGYLQAFDLFGMRAKTQLRGDRMCDSAAIASDWNYVGDFIGSAMTHYGQNGNGIETRQ